MILIHENMSRGRTQKGWLDAFHTFSFGEFKDPTRMGFGPLRVINEDRIIPGAGFAAHSHADMDILTLPLSGNIRHEDSMGNASVIAPGEMQLMSAGSGITHSEMNASATEPAHVLQIWMMPDTAGGTPFYQQATLPLPNDGWSLLASGDGTAPLRLGSDSRILMAHPRDGDRLALPAGKGLAFLQIVEGIATVEGERLVAGDGIQIAGEVLPELEWKTDGQVLLFDMS